MRKTERQRERKREQECSHSLIHFPNDQAGMVQVELHSGFPCGKLFAATWDVFAVTISELELHSELELSL